MVGEKCLGAWVLKGWVQFWEYFEAVGTDTIRIILGTNHDLKNYKFMTYDRVIWSKKIEFYQTKHECCNLYSHDDLKDRHEKYKGFSGCSLWFDRMKWVGSINIQTLIDENMRVFYCNKFNMKICTEEVYKEEYLIIKWSFGEHDAKKKGVRKHE